MMTGNEHRDRAELLLDIAHDTMNHESAALAVAMAQVHATLALAYVTAQAADV